MTLPFEKAEKNAHQFMAGLHTMHELVVSVKEHERAIKMIEACSRHKDLEPGIKDFQDELDEIETFWLTLAKIYQATGQIES